MIGLLQLDRDGELSHVLHSQWVKTRNVKRGEDPLGKLHRRTKLFAMIRGAALTFLLSSLVTMFVNGSQKFEWGLLTGVFLGLGIVGGIIDIFLFSDKDQTGFAENFAKFSDTVARPLHTLVSLGLKELQELADQVLFSQAAKVLEIEKAQTKHSRDSLPWNLLETDRLRSKNIFHDMHFLFHDKFGLVEAQHDRFYEQNPLIKPDEKSDPVNNGAV